MHNLQNGIYTFFREIHLISLNFVVGAFRLGLPSSPTEIDVTMGLGISVLENEIYVTIVLGIFVLENYTLPLPRNDPEGTGGYTQPTRKETKSTYKRIAKKHALECKSKFIEN